MIVRFVMRVTTTIFNTVGNPGSQLHQTCPQARTRLVEIQMLRRYVIFPLDKVDPATEFIATKCKHAGDIYFECRYIATVDGFDGICEREHKC